MQLNFSQRIRDGGERIARVHLGSLILHPTPVTVVRRKIQNKEAASAGARGKLSNMKKTRVLGVTAECANSRPLSDRNDNGESYNFGVHECCDCRY